MGKNILVMMILIGGQLWAKPLFSLYTDKKAKSVGDVITVYIMEESKAGSDSRTETDKESKLATESSVGTGLLDFLPGFGFDSQSDLEFDGRGKTSRAGSLRAKLAAVITQILDNGNLVIEGSKQLTLNEETEIITVSGVIRPGDISPNNVVMSTSIADAQIRYAGEGVVGDAEEPGLLTRFFNWIF